MPGSGVFLCPGDVRLGLDVSWPPSGFELTQIRQRFREADAGIGVFSLAYYTEAMDQLDDAMLEKNPNWRPWGTRSIQ